MIDLIRTITITITILVIWCSCYSYCYLSSHTHTHERAHTICRPCGGSRVPNSPGPRQRGHVCLALGYRHWVCGGFELKQMLNMATQPQLSRSLRRSTRSSSTTGSWLCVRRVTRSLSSAKRRRCRVSAVLPELWSLCFIVLASSSVAGEGGERKECSGICGELRLEPCSLEDATPWGPDNSSLLNELDTRRGV